MSSQKRAQDAGRLPDHLPPKLSIDLWIWSWIVMATPGEPYDDLERCVVEIKERGFNTTILLGGARNTGHFTEFVGGDIHCTINWSTAEELLDLDLPVESRIDALAAEDVVDDLLAKSPHFYRAYVDDALPVEQFADFGPVVHFRNSFMAGYSRLLEEVAARRRLVS